MRERAERAARWLSRWGFAMLVGIGAIAAVWAGATVELPETMPSFALKAASVYRLEVGAAVLVAGYLASLALVLAFNNRAFTEIGTGGVKAQDIGGADEKSAIRKQGESLKALAEIVKTLRADVRRTDRTGG